MSTATYRLHILAHKSQPERSYTLMLARAESRGGAMQSVPYATWEKLRAALSGVHTHDEVLAHHKKELDEKRSTTITEMLLTDDQVEQLGFPKPGR
jgi:hypothetical protein